jgi:nitrogen fixation protein FixH
VCSSDLHTGFAGVVAHKQEDAAKAIAHHLSNEHALRELGWSVEIGGLETMKAGVPRDVTIRISDRDGRGVEGVSVNLGLARPGARPDTITTLNGVGNGTYHAQMKVDSAGTWVAYPTLMLTAKPIHLEHTINVP